MSRARHLLRSSIIVIFFFGLGKLTGLVRTRLVSVAFGTGAEIDAFAAANQLPEVFFTVIAGGSLAAAFIPVYSDYLANRSTRDSLRLANTIMTLVMIVLGTISAVGAIFAPWLVQVVLVPDFPPETQALTASIMQVILIQTTLFGISGVLSSILNAHQHFALPALAPVMLDLGYFFGLFVLVPQMGIIGLAWGTVIGALLHILIQVPALRRYSYRYRPSMAVGMSGVKEVLRLMVPRIVTLGTIQVADLFIIRLASALAVGSTSGYFYAYALMQFPETLFGTAIALVVFPTLSEQFNAGDLDALKTTASRALRIIWFLTLPAAAAVVLLGRPAIAVLLQGGAFTAESAEIVYGVLLIFSVRIVSEATVELAARLFYAQHNTVVPMFAYMGWLVVDIVLVYWLIDSLEIAALALASTIAFTFLAVALLLLNNRALGNFLDRTMAVSALRTAAATAGMSLVIMGVSRFITSPLILLAVGGLCGGTAYLLFSVILGGDEIPRLLELIRTRDTA